MVKQSKPKEESFYFKDGVRLIETPKFTYSVDVCKFLPNHFNLEDSKYIQSPTHQVATTEYFVKDGVRFKKEVYLIGAPLSWLTENNFIKQ